MNERPTLTIHLQLPANTKLHGAVPVYYDGDIIGTAVDTESGSAAFKLTHALPLERWNQVAGKLNSGPVRAKIYESCELTLRDKVTHYPRLIILNPPD